MGREYFLRSAAILEHLIDDLRQIKIDADMPMMVVISKFSKKSTADQRAMLHGLISDIAENTPWSAAAWKEFFKREFVGADEIVMPDGEIIIHGRSTTGLNREQYSELIQKVIAYAHNVLELKV